MGKILANQQLIAQPPTGPLRYGLFTAATLAELDIRGSAAGIQWISDHCGIGTTTNDQTCDTSPTKPFIEGSDLFGGDPFTLFARKRCGTVGRTAEEAVAAARAQLESDEQTLVESVLWDGQLLTNVTPTLTSVGAAVVVPSAPGAGAAIAALEASFYAVHGYRGTIHVNPSAYAAVAYSNLVLHDYPGAAGRLMTPLGSTWSFGAGYGITGPADAAPAAGFVWAFITAPVTIWRNPIATFDARQTLDRAANQWDTIAERRYIAAFDCQEHVWAVQVPVAAPAVATAPAVP